AVGRAYLARLGVPPARLKAETRSHTTLENLEFSRPLLRGPVTLVTDEVHAPRALALARALGLDADVSSVRLSRPDPRYQLREKLALLAYIVLGVQDDRRR
ncbi:MAG: YdcF family protein, partial [Deinococcus sp.]